MLYSYPFIVQLYDAFEKRARIQVNRFIKNNTLLKKYLPLCLRSTLMAHILMVLLF